MPKTTKEKVFWLRFVVGPACLFPAFVSIANAQGDFVGPGDRPSICVERSRPLVELNMSTMTKIADRLKKNKNLDEIGLIRLKDGSVELSTSREGEIVEVSEREQNRFLSLFEQVTPNIYAPSAFYETTEFVLARTEPYYPGLMMANGGAWCGGTDEEWIKESEKMFTAGVTHGGPMFYAYSRNGAELQEPCSDEVFLTEKFGYCDIRLSRNWLLVFEFLNLNPDDGNLGE